MPGFVLVFGLIVIILIVTTLASRLVEGSPLSFPLIFLGFGFVLGSGGVARLRARVSWKAHTSISWCGLRGLNSLLLALLVVQAGVPGAELLLAVVGVVVLASVVIHGASASTISAWSTKHAREETLVEKRESTAAGLFAHDEGDIPRITPEEMDKLLRGPTPPIVLDVRSRSSYDSDGAQIPHSVQVLPITSPSGPPTNPSTGWWSLTAPEATRQPAPVRRNT